MWQAGMMRHGPEMVAMTVGFTSVIATSAIELTMQWNVNRALPKKQRFPYLRWRRDRTKHRQMIVRMYRKIYPGSSLPTLGWYFACISLLGFLCGVLLTAKRCTT
jgi:hypothetical protein